MDGLTSHRRCHRTSGAGGVQPGDHAAGAAVAGALAGFLFVNRPPARMYMGDSGSLMAGIHDPRWRRSRRPTPNTACTRSRCSPCPAALALFDTSLVIAFPSPERGARSSSAGRDHFSHRLLLLAGHAGRSWAVRSPPTCAALLIAALADSYPRAMPGWRSDRLRLRGAWLRLLRVDPTVPSTRARGDQCLRTRTSVLDLKFVQKCGRRAQARRFWRQGEGNGGTRRSASRCVTTKCRAP